MTKFTLKQIQANIPSFSQANAFCEYLERNNLEINETHSKCFHKYVRFGVFLKTLSHELRTYIKSLFVGFNKRTYCDECGNMWSPYGSGQCDCQCDDCGVYRSSCFHQIVRPNIEEESEREYVYDKNMCDCCAKPRITDTPSESCMCWCSDCRMLYRDCKHSVEEEVVYECGGNE